MCLGGGFSCVYPSAGSTALFLHAVPVHVRLCGGGDALPPVAPSMMMASGVPGRGGGGSRVYTTWFRPRNASRPTRTTQPGPSASSCTPPPPPPPPSAQLPTAAADSSSAVVDGGGAPGTPSVPEPPASACSASHSSSCVVERTGRGGRPYPRSAWRPQYLFRGKHRRRTGKSQPKQQGCRAQRTPHRRGRAERALRKARGEHTARHDGEGHAVRQRDLRDVAAGLVRVQAHLSIRVRGLEQITGSQTYSIVGKSQPVLFVIHPMISPRTRIDTCPPPQAGCAADQPPHSEQLSSEQSLCNRACAQSVRVEEDGRDLHAWGGGGPPGARPPPRAPGGAPGTAGRRARTAAASRRPRRSRLLWTRRARIA
eukprot:COSAG01_NODE_3364_length_6193_cov_5.789465_2_plen_369_part_00